MKILLVERQEDLLGIVNRGFAGLRPKAHFTARDPRPKAHF